MKIENRSPDMTLARQRYSLEVRQLLRSSREYTRKSIREERWSMSFSTSSRYSLDLGILLADEETIVTKNKSMDLLGQTILDVQFMDKVLEENPIKGLIERKMQQGRLYMLDLMSYGAVHKEVGVSGCVVALTDRRKEMEKEVILESDALGKKINTQTDIQLVSGDLLSSSTWREVNRYIATYTSGERFGIILCHPLAGLDYIPENMSAYQYLFSRIYDVLSPNEGTFLTNFHARMYEQVAELCKRLSAVPGIKVMCYPEEDFSSYGKFMLVRSHNSPERLPVISS